jgi:hypothetical protein
LDTTIKEIYVYQRGHLTPLGLFELLAEHPDEVIVLDDLTTILKSCVGLQILLSALEHPKTSDRSRIVKYRRQGKEQRVNFRGGIICISNLELHHDALLDAFRSRVHTLNYNPSDATLGALILHIASLGWPVSRPTVAAEEGEAIARFVIGEMIRLGCHFDLRLFVDRALPTYQQWKDGETESDWRDLITATIEEHLVEIRHEVESPVSREQQKQEEHSIIRELLQIYSKREERVEEWIKRTGKSERAYYRRRAELDVR